MANDSASNPRKFNDPFPAELYRELAVRLRHELPPRPDDSPEDRARREQALIALVASLAPANEAEADAVLCYVLASEEGREWLHCVQTAGTSVQQAVQYRGKAIAAMGKAEKALNLLLRLQKARRKLEAGHQAGDSGSGQRPAPAASPANAERPTRVKPAGRSGAEIARLWGSIRQENRTIH